MEKVDKLQNVSGIQTEHEYWKQYRGLTKRYGLEVSGLYGYLLDKRGLSMKKTREGTHNFMDADGVYCIVSYEELETELNLTGYKIKKCKKILRDIGLITEKRQMDGGNKIYVWDIPIWLDYKYGR